MPNRPDPIDMRKGIHQGDPLSVAGNNCMMAHIIDMAEESWPNAEVCIYADDISTHCGYKPDIENVAKMCITFLADCGIMVNQDKSRYLQIGSAAGCLHLPNAEVAPATEITVLGTRYFAHGDAIDPSRSESAKKHLLQMVRKLDALPFAEHYKENVVGATIMPRLNYSRWTISTLQEKQPLEYACNPQEADCKRAQKHRPYALAHLQAAPH